MRPQILERESPAATIPVDTGRGHLLALLASPRPAPEALRAAIEAVPSQALPRLIAALVHERIDGLAYRALRSFPAGAVSPWLRSALKRRSQKIAAATLAQGLALAEILEALHEAHIPVMVMRGLRSVESLYGDPASRPFEDHDLLVLPADRARVVSMLERHGLEPAAAGLFRRGGFLIDLHCDPLGAARRPSRRLLLDLPVERLFERSAIGTVAGAPARLADPCDELLLLAIHVVKHSFDRLIRTADLAHLLAGPGGAALAEAALRRAGAAPARDLLVWACQAAEPLGVPLPGALSAARPEGRLQSRILRSVVRLRPLPYAGEMLMTLALRGAGARLRFLWDAVCPITGPSQSASRTGTTARAEAAPPEVTRAGAARRAR